MLDSSVLIDINFRESSFTPPKVPPLWNSQSLAFLALNFLTLGIYSTVDALNRRFTIKQLEADQKALCLKIHKTLKNFVKLQGELTIFQNDLDVELQRNPSKDEIKSQFTPFIQKIKTFKNQVQVFEDEDFSVKSFCVRTIVDKIRVVFQVIGEMFLNLASLGLYGWWNKYRVIEPLINHLDAKSSFIQKESKSNLSEQVKSVQSLCTRLQESIKLKRHWNTLANTDTDVDRVRVHYSTLQIKYEDLNDQYEDLLHQKTALESQITTLEKTRRGLETQISQLNGKIATSEIEKDHLKTSVQQQADQITSLINEKATIGGELERANNRVSLLNQQLEELRKEMRLFKQSKTNWTHSQHLITSLGPIPSLYMKRDSDGDIPGEFELDPTGDYARTYNEKRAINPSISHEFLILDTLPKVVQKAFQTCYRKLLEWPLNAQGHRTIYFNSSSAIYEDLNYLPHKYAFLSYMMLDLLSGAKLCKERECGTQYVVKFNEEVSIASSMTSWVLAYNKDASDGEQFYRRILWDYTDEMTPKARDKDDYLFDGIDPEGAKRALHQLTAEGNRHHLINLILEPFIPSEYLIGTKRFMAQKNRAEVQLVDVAYTLFRRLGIALDRSAIKDHLDPLWLEYASDRDVKLLLKTPIKVSKPLPAARPWHIDLKYFIETSSGSHPAETPFIELEGSDLRKMLERYDFIFDQVTEKHLKYPLSDLRDSENRRIYNVPSDGNKALSLFKYQYYISHVVYEDHHCLFSNLAALMCNEWGAITPKTTQRLKDAMAKFLDEPSHKETYREAIGNLYSKKIVYANGKEETRGMSVEDYQYWLRHGNSKVEDTSQKATISYHIDHNTSLGELEIEIAAFTLGIQIAVFSSGCPIKIENGLMVPGDNDYYFGPNAVSIDHKPKRFLMLNIDGLTFYGMRPKMEMALPEDVDRAFKKIKNKEAIDMPVEMISKIKIQGELRDAIQQVNAYWARFELAPLALEV